MKLTYKSKLKCWCNSTNTLKYYPFKQEATSYDHWLILKNVDDKLILNTYSYSSTTSKHITALCYFLDNHYNIQPFLAIDSPINLNQDNCLVEYRQFLEIELQAAKRAKKRESIINQLIKLNQVSYETV